MCSLLKSICTLYFFITLPVFSSILLRVDAISNVTRDPGTPYISYDIEFTELDVSSRNTSPPLNCQSGCKMAMMILQKGLSGTMQPAWGKGAEIALTKDVTNEKELLEYYVKQTGAVPKSDVIHVRDVAISGDDIPREQCMALGFNDGTVPPFPGRHVLISQNRM